MLQLLSRVINLIELISNVLDLLVLDRCHTCDFVASL